MNLDPLILTVNVHSFHPTIKVVGDWARPASPLYDYYGWDPAVEHDKAAAGLQLAWVAVRKAAIAGAEVNVWWP